MAGRKGLLSIQVEPTPIMGGLLGVPGSDDVAAGPPDMSDRYNTPLGSEEEAAFRQWLAQLSAAKGYDASEDLRDYDLRGAWKYGAQQAANGHLPDTYKKPNHPTFSTGSQYSNQQTAGGAWSDLGNDKWAFHASPFNLQMTGAERLGRYFDRVERGNTLQTQNPITPTPVGLPGAQR